jgi:hypothetical protein
MMVDASAILNASILMTICRELQRSHRSRSFTFASGKLSPRCARSLTSDSRAECLHLRQYAP